jgi:hypothetical protein
MASALSSERSAAHMIAYDDEIIANKNTKAVLKKLARHIFLLVVGFLLLATPCYLVFWLILSGE